MCAHDSVGALAVEKIIATDNQKNINYGQLKLLTPEIKK
jgi:hypothetical protein